MKIVAAVQGITAAPAAQTTAMPQRTSVKPFPYSIEELEILFILDRKNGVLIRGKPARGRKRGEIPPKGNYRRVKIDGNLYFEHRVIWMMEHRQHIPEGCEIDHINRDHYDNRPQNLRLALHRQNLVNREVPTGRSGFRGVRRSRNGRFQACIVENGKRHSLGSFGTADAAAAAYDTAALQLHGAFAMTNARMGLLPD
ncbi:HNH endonuclease signature motif containing protein [Noviherbaspirillum aridicola]|uniref:HNH endonuclease signature motif containing protein n=1 Tax=Noviherbaspirillum aridicola TaxID=2849687 RepID=UPI0035A24BBC